MPEAVLHPFAATSLDCVPNEDALSCWLLLGLRCLRICMQQQ